MACAEWLFINASVRQYLSARFPLHLYGASIVVTFYCALALFDAAATSSTVMPSSLIGAISLVLLFLASRLIDDIDDFEADHGYRGAFGPIPGPGRRSLIVGLTGTIAAIVGLNWSSKAALIVATAAVGVMLLGPFVLKPLVLGKRDPRRYTTGHWLTDLVLFVVFESAQFLTLLYIYFFWTSISRSELPASMVGLITTMFWTTYVFWKYSRFLTRSTPPPFEMTRNALRIALIGDLSLVVICTVAIGVLVGLSVAWIGYIVATACVFAAWLTRLRPAGDGSSATAMLDKAIGLLFAANLNLSLVAAVVDTAVNGRGSSSIFAGIPI